jgi:hypothetical protein
MRNELAVAKDNLNRMNTSVIIFNEESGLLPLYVIDQSTAIVTVYEEFPEEAEFRILGTYEYIQELEATLPKLPKDPEWHHYEFAKDFKKGVEI